MIEEVEPSSANAKRKKLTGDERLSRNRERNKIHAKKTRERKKMQTKAIQSRIQELLEEGKRLRQLVDERYTACSLLGLSRNVITSNETAVLPSSSICKDFLSDIKSDKNFQILDQNVLALENTTCSPSNKRIRRSGKYSPQERELIRRERNRIHAKKTRDRKRNFLSVSEKIIEELENEEKSLKGYLLSLKLISNEEFEESIQKAYNFHESINQLKEPYELQFSKGDSQSLSSNESDKQISLDGSNSESLMTSTSSIIDSITSK